MVSRPRTGIWLILAVACARDGPDSRADSAATPVVWRADTAARYQVQLAGWPYVEQRALDSLAFCGDATPVVTSDSIGFLRPGLTHAALRARCPSLRYGWYLHPSHRRWSPAAALRVGAAALVVHFADTLPGSEIVRVATLDGGARTAEGIGLGTPAPALAAAYPALELVALPCAIWARMPGEPRLRINLSPPESHSDAWECGALRALAARNDIGALPRDTRVGDIVIERELPDTATSPAAGPAGP